MLVIYAGRAIQFICSAIVLGLSVPLNIIWNRNGKGRPEELSANLGGMPAMLRYSAFAGGFGIVVALNSALMLHSKMSPWRVMVVLDAVTAVIFIIGATALANWVSFWRLLVQICEGNCTDVTRFLQIFAPDAAFLFLSFFTAVALIGTTFVEKKRRQLADRNQVQMAEV